MERRLNDSELLVMLGLSMQQLVTVPATIRPLRPWLSSALVISMLYLGPPAVMGQDIASQTGAQLDSDPELAQSASADTVELPPENMLFWVIRAAGWFFFPLQFFISFVIIGMIVLYAMQVRMMNFVPPEFLQQFDTCFKEKRFQEVYELARKDESFLGKMMASGIARLSAGYSQAMEAMQEVAEDESMKHEQRLSYLAMMGNLAVMVGLLGTVWGMTASFMVISRSDTAPRPSELAEGVSTALVTTVWGLLQAIPAILAHTILKNRATRLGFEAGITSQQLINRFSSVTRRSLGPETSGTSHSQSVS